MSHLSKIDLEVDDLDALEEGAPECGFVLERDKRRHKWYGKFMDDTAEGRLAVAEIGLENLGKCDHVLRLKDATREDYEIGLYKKPGGGYRLFMDTWGPGGRLQQMAGPGCGRLKQAYGAAVAMKKAKATLQRRGFVTTKELLASGVIRLRSRRR